MSGRWNRATAARACAACGLALALWSWSGHVLADAKSDEKAPKAAVQAGDDRYEHKDYAGALEQYLAALAKVPAMRTKLKIGRCHLHLNNLARAQEAFRRILQEAGHSAPSTDTQRVARDAEQELDGLVGRVPQIRFKVNGPHPDDVRITVDGVAIPAEVSHWWVSFDPGRHRVEISAAGRKPTTLEIEAKEGERVVTEATLAELPQPPQS